MLLAFDDTDSRKGMCTTYLVTEMLGELEGCDLIGLPRLVRLNPMVPWKTRGNGAVCMELGRGAGEMTEVGEINGEPVISYSDKAEAFSAFELEDILTKAVRVIERLAHQDEEGTNPGVAAFPYQPPAELYWQGVRDIVELDDVLDHLDGAGAAYKGFKNQRGLIGATCAAAWEPGDFTYELLAYRKKENWGTPRSMELDSVIEIDERFPGTFNNYDGETGHIALLPNSPCPILYGIRGESTDELVLAKDVVRTPEEYAGWLLFLTNQGTGDHVVGKKLHELMPFTSARVAGTVEREPRTIVGGHVLFSVSSGEKEVDCAAYEPTKEFRDIVRALAPGDKVEIIGGVREKPRTLNVEKLRVIEITSAYEKTGNPPCPECGKRMKSAGAGQGYRCRPCGTKADNDMAEFSEIRRALVPGWYEAPVGARRHLHKPLKRGEPAPL